MALRTFRILNHILQKPNSTEIKISAQDAHVYYGDFEAIKGIDLDIYQNEVIAFIGIRLR